MALMILAAHCTACGACELECPNAAIGMVGDAYAISAKTCSECDGDDPKCLAVCPVDDCIVVG